MIKRFFSQAWLYHKGRAAAFSMAEFLCFDTGYPIITLIFYCLLASYSFQTTDLSRWVIGNAFLMCTNTCVFSLGGIFTGERYYGRLRSIVAAPCGKLPLILASGLFPALLAALSVTAGLLVGALVFQLDFSQINLGLAALTILCAMVSSTCFGLFLAVLGLLTDSMHLVLNVVSYVLMIFTGAEFPITQLPLAGQIFSRLLPLTRSIQAMQLLFQKDSSGLAALLSGELCTAAAYTFLAWFLFRFAERLCRRSGKLELF